MAVIKRRECDLCGENYKILDGTRKQWHINVKCLMTNVLFRIDLCPVCISKLKKVKSFNDSIQKAYDEVIDESFKKGYDDDSLSTYLDGVCKFYDRIIQLGARNGD